MRIPLGHQLLYFYIQSNNDNTAYIYGYLLFQNNMYKGCDSLKMSIQDWKIKLTYISDFGQASEGSLIVVLFTSGILLFSYGLLIFHVLDRTSSLKDFMCEWLLHRQFHSETEAQIKQAKSFCCTFKNYYN